MYTIKESNICYIQEYEPYHVYDEYNDKIINPYFNKATGGRVLDLKENDDDAINYYYDILSNELDSIKNKNNICIAVVPSHDKNNGQGAVHEIGKRLCKNKGFIDATGCLKRIVTIDKLANGGDRSKQVHLDSIEVKNRNIIKDRNVIVLDDVTTSGNSLIGCCELLKNAGANKVACLSIAKTVHHEKYHENNQIVF